jgi:molecular chaperone DnaK
LEKMNTIWQKASEHMYKDTQGGGQTPPPPGAGADGGNDGPAGGGDDEVTDVDFEEVDDNK